MPEEEALHLFSVEMNLYWFEEHGASFEVKAMQNIVDASEDLPLSNIF